MPDSVGFGCGFGIRHIPSFDDETNRLFTHSHYTDAQFCCCCILSRVVPDFWLRQIRYPAIFAEIRPSPALAKFLAGFAGLQCIGSTFG